jgi:phosphoglycerate-specific signal transduction histidine kinase
MRPALSIRSRLILAMTMSVLLLLAVSGSFFTALTRVDRATLDLNTRWLPAVRGLAEAKYLMESQRLRFVRAVFTPDATERREILADSAQRRADVVQALETYERVLRGDPELARLATIRNTWRAYLAEEQDITSAQPTLSLAELSDRVNERSRVLFDAVNDAVNDAIAHIDTKAGQSSAEAVSTFDRATRVSLTLFLCALGLLALFVVFVIRSVSRPIDRISGAMRRLARGNRDIFLDGLHGGDEIGRMAAAVEVFRIHLIERDAAREALQRANDHLEEKIDLRSSELRTANAALHAEIEERIEAGRRLESMQQELIRTENLAVIGQLSAGIAHELNQPLAALATLSQNAVRFLELGEEAVVRENLSRIVRLVERMGIVTGRLRSFARRSGNEREAVDLTRSVDNALALLGHRHDHEPMKIVLSPPARPVRVFANAVRIEQILVNLISNAFDATRGVEGASATIAWEHAGEKAILTVRDNGPGFAPDILTRIFEPFFSTKSSGGGGLGLGLAISADIARLYDGSLAAAEAPGGGAIFTLTLPADDDSSAPGSGNPESGAVDFPESSPPPTAKPPENPEGETGTAHA